MSILTELLLLAQLFPNRVDTQVPAESSPPLLPSSGTRFDAREKASEKRFYISQIQWQQLDQVQ
jgi:hypothetical protein